MAVSADTVFGVVCGVVGTIVLAYPIAFMKRRAERHAEKSLGEHLHAFALSKWALRCIALSQLGMLAFAAFTVWHLLPAEMPAEMPATRGDVLKAISAGFALASALVSRLLVMTIERMGKLTEQSFRVLSALANRQLDRRPEAPQ